VAADGRGRRVGGGPSGLTVGDRGQNVCDGVRRVRVDLDPVVYAGRRQRLEQVRAVLEMNRRCATNVHQISTISQPTKPTYNDTQ